ncbi:MAG: helix-turn-helix domain-containing protein [Cyclobacteriaceae bacterium]|jgi:AraC-like DNA-binding protein|nr:helix-turn-helix domain-containing protein [Cyclobacteriaceae bacterium]
MNFRAYPPGEKLTGIIKRHCIYEQEFSNDKPNVQPILPLVVPTLEFVYGDQFHTVQYSDGKRDKVPYHGILGPITHRKIYLEMSGRIGVYCVEFHPAAFYSLFRLPMQELADISVEADVLLGKEIHDITGRIIEAVSDYERIVIMEQYISKRAGLNQAPVVKTKQAIKEMHRYAGLCSVHLLAKHLDISERHLENVFKSQIGVSPKLYNRILRFNKVFALMQNNPTHRPWQDIIQECGFYDQSHFIREFRYFTGTTPTSYFNKSLEFERFFLGSNASN